MIYSNPIGKICLFKMVRQNFIFQQSLVIPFVWTCFTLLFQLPGLEFLLRRSQITKLVNWDPDRRKRECLKLLIENFLQVILRGQTDSHMWIEFLSGCFRYKRFHIVDSRLVDLWFFLCGNECSWCACFYHERLDSIDELLLDPDQILSWLNYNSGKSEVIEWYVVVLVGFQFPGHRLLIG